MINENQKLTEIILEMTAFVEVLHQDIIKKIKEKKINREEAMIVFEEEQKMRQDISKLHLEVLDDVLSEVEDDMKNIKNIIAVERKNISEIEDIKKYIEIVMKVVTLGGIICAKNSKKIILTSKEIVEIINEVV